MRKVQVAPILVLLLLEVYTATSKSLLSKRGAVEDVQDDNGLKDLAKQLVKNRGSGYIDCDNILVWDALLQEEENQERTIKTCDLCSDDEFLKMHMELFEKHCGYGKGGFPPICFNPAGWENLLYSFKEEQLVKACALCDNGMFRRVHPEIFGEHCELDEENEEEEDGEEDEKEETRETAEEEDEDDEKEETRGTAEEEDEDDEKEETRGTAEEEDGEDEKEETRGTAEEEDEDDEKEDTRGTAEEEDGEDEKEETRGTAEEEDEEDEKEETRGTAEEEDEEDEKEESREVADFIDKGKTDDDLAMPEGGWQITMKRGDKKKL
ncbi:cyclic nucleotide gated channel beta 1 [Branchiostoma belcheri]|nr:cyclic nucleotide gated channel beta 1 [Branchiostoma belcheri]